MTRSIQALAIVALAALGLLAVPAPAEAGTWADLARGLEAEKQAKQDRHAHRDDHRHRRAHFDHRHRNVRRAMRRHGIARWGEPVWTGSGFRVIGHTAHGIVDVVFAHPSYAMRSAVPRRHVHRPRSGWTPRYDDHRPHRLISERRAHRIAARRFGLDVRRAHCRDGRWILVGKRPGHGHGRWRLVLDAYSGEVLRFHRARGHG